MVPKKILKNAELVFDTQFKTQDATITSNANTANAIRNVCKGFYKPSGRFFLPKDAKTVIFEDNQGVRLAYRVKHPFDDNYDSSDVDVSKVIIPEVCDVEVINNKVVIVYFDDGTVEKAVLSENDTYSFEYGVSICITKRILSGMTNGNGTSAYNKLIDYALKIYKDNRKWEEEEAKFREKAIADDKRRAEKDKQRRIKIAKKKREREIEIQTEAYYRAIKKFDEEKMKEFALGGIPNVANLDNNAGDDDFENQI